MPRRRRAHPRPISELIRAAHPAPEQFDAARVFSWWCTALPERIVDRARPVRLDKGVLWVHVSSSTWAQELHHMVAELMGRLRAAHPQAKVRVIRFRVGPLPELPRPRRPIRRRPTPLPIAVLPEDVGRALAAIADDDLRNVIARAAATSLTVSEASRRSSERSARAARRPPHSRDDRGSPPAQES